MQAPLRCEIPLLLRSEIVVRHANNPLHRGVNENVQRLGGKNACDDGSETNLNHPVTNTRWPTPVSSHHTKEPVASHHDRQYRSVVPALRNAKADCQPGQDEFSDRKPARTAVERGHGKKSRPHRMRSRWQTPTSIAKRIHV